MTAWAARPVEIRNLFNPAFCGLLQATAIRSFEQEDKSGLPFSLSLLVLPLCLHESTRQVLNEHDRAYLLKLVADHPGLRVGLASRVRQMLPFTFEAQGLLHRYGALTVADGGRLKVPPRKVSSSFEPGSDEVRACLQAARFLGRQLGRIGDPVTVYASVGLKP